MIRALALALLALALTGCAPQDPDSLETKIQQLKAENGQLEAQLAQLEAVSFAQRVKLDDTFQLIRREVQAANIAAACDYLIPLCPDSIAEPGRSLLATGYYGAGGWSFWGLVGAKFTAWLLSLGSTILLLWFGSGWLYLHLFQPKRAAVERARAEIERAQNSAEEERRAVEAAQLELSQWQEGIEQAEAELDARRASVAEIDARIAARQAEADELDAKVQRLEARRAAMLGRE